MSSGAFLEFFRFDLRYQLRSPLWWVAGFVFALLALDATSSDFVQIGGAIGNVHRNAPEVVVRFYASFSVLGLFLVTAFIALPLLRDFELNTDELFFSTPMRVRDYLLGRLAAGSIVSLIVFVMLGAGMVLGAAMPWVEPERLGPFSLAPHVWSLAVLVIPNLIFSAALTSLLAVTARSLLSAYVGVVAFFALWTTAGLLTQDIKYDLIASLIDPFGTRPFEIATRYWSANERNTLLPEVGGYFLINRALWLGIATAFLTAAFRLFRPQRFRGSKRWLRRHAVAASSGATIAVVPTAVPMQRSFGSGAVAKQLLHQLRFDTAGVLKSVPFLALLAFATLNLIVGSTVTNDFYGTKILPVTAIMLRVIEGSYAYVLFLIIGFYAGELVWRERSSKLSELTDSLPVPNWLPLLAKIGALFAVVLVFMVVGSFTSASAQLLRGYTNLEPGLYLQSGLIQSVPFLLMAVAAVALQVVSNDRFMGYFLFVLLIIARFALPALHLEHNLYNFAATPQTPYSDMNGFGHFLRGWGWFSAYWGLFAAILVILASAFWVRGISPPWRVRLAAAKNNLRGPLAVVLAGLMVAFAGTGAFIYYNTNVLNPFLPRDVVMDRQAHFEKSYRKYKGVAQPSIASVYADVDIFPAQRRVDVRGRYHLINKHAGAITDLHLFMDPRASLTIEGFPAELISEDRSVGYRLYRLKEPLQPGATLDFSFAVARAERGFTNNGLPPAGGGGDARSTLNYNGTFFNNLEMFPHFGYNESLQLLDRGERRKRDLGEVPRAAKLEDESARDSIGFPDSDWLDFETTVSTSADQTALAPGYLQREWTQNGRRYFHYKMDRPMLPFFCYLSARWQVKRDTWHGMPIEVYYDAKHPYNIDRMIEGAKKSLDYFTTNFSPYQHRQVRILEFPGYARFAQSFANTIPYSEAIGFIADLRKPEDLDYVFYVTAHEVAHQWWAHQVIGADLQGQAMLSESLSQYSALMVMEKEYGPRKMRKFLKYELDRYLRGRGGELIEELPLMRVENQPYIHYQKGSLVFYRLRDEIGEETLNRAIAKYIADKAFQSAPFTTTREFLDYVRAEAPADKHALIDELFGKIVFYDNKVVAANQRKRADGKYDVTLEFALGKRTADGTGKETSIPIDDWMDVGVFARGKDEKEDNETVLYLDKHHITEDSRTVTVTVDAPPYEAGLDPYNKLIDRLPDDNRKRVEDEGK